MDVTGFDMPGGDIMLMGLDEQADHVVFLDENDVEVARYGTRVFAEVRGPLALRLGEGLVVPGDVVAMLQQWARLDLA